MAVYKFWKLTGGFKWQVDSGKSHGIACGQVVIADVSEGGAQIELVLGNHRIQIRSVDTAQIEGSAASGTMEEIRDRLINEVLSNQSITA